MTRLNIVLLAVLSGCALSLITAQHQARRAHVALERAQSEARHLDADWNHLRMQQTSLSASALIDARARGQLGMDIPSPQRTFHALRDPASGELRVGTVALPAAARPAQRNPMAPGAVQPVGAGKVVR
jgi:cell division protein FtsL